MGEDGKDPQRIAEHLSQILTTWTLFRLAHEGSPEVSNEAQSRLLLRYGTPVYRYFLGAVRDEETADELFQEFALKFVRGDFHRANPEVGRFRRFLKSVLINMVIDYRKKQKRQALQMPESGVEAVDEPESDKLVEDEARFLNAWRAELFDRAWAALETHEKQTGQPLHTVLRHRFDHPDEKSPEMAERLSVTLGKPVNPGWVRKRLHYAREKFSDCLLAEVARSVERPTRANLEEELLDLGLLDPCRGALERWHHGET